MFLEIQNQKTKGAMRNYVQHNTEKTILKEAEQPRPDSPRKLGPFLSFLSPTSESTFLCLSLLRHVSVAHVHHMNLPRQGRGTSTRERERAALSVWLSPAHLESFASERLRVIRDSFDAFLVRLGLEPTRRVHEVSQFVVIVELEVCPLPL